MSITIQRIKQLADQQGRSLKFLCEKIGMKGRSYFNDIEKNHRTIPIDKLEIIADILDTTTDYLLGNSDNPSEPLPQAKNPYLTAPATREETILLKAIRQTNDAEYNAILALLTQYITSEDSALLHKRKKDVI